MADKLKDLNPLSIHFLSGESPSHTKLNAWAKQIETGFYRLEELLGDLYHSEDAKLETTYFNNLTRNMGNVGKAQWRVPTRESFTYRQHLTAGEKVHLLDFYPHDSDEDAFAANVNQNAAITNGGAANPDTRHTADRDGIGAGQWHINGRLLLTEKAAAGGGGGNEYVDYVVNTNNSFWNRGPDRNSANIIPSLAQIDANDPTGGPYNLCTVVDDGAATTFTVTLPEIKNWYDAEGNAVTFAVGGAGTSGVTGVVPKYNLPGYLTSELSLVNGNTIPTGLIQLWRVYYDALDNIKDIKPIRNTQSDDPIVYTYVSATQFKFTIPASMTAPEAATVAPGEDPKHYVVSVGGTSASDLLKQLLDMALQHDHSGTDNSAAVSHRNLSGAFKKSLYTHSPIDFNDHPQYLHREGYDAGDTQNGANSMLGHLHLASTEVGDPLTDASLFDDFSDVDEASFKLLLGPVADDSGIFFDKVNNTYADYHKWEVPNGKHIWLHTAGNNSTLLWLGSKHDDQTLPGPYLNVSEADARASFSTTHASAGRRIGVQASALHSSEGYLYWSGHNPDNQGSAWENGDVTDVVAGAVYTHRVQNGAGNGTDLFNWRSYSGGYAHHAIEGVVYNPSIFDALTAAPGNTEDHRFVVVDTVTDDFVEFQGSYTRPPVGVWLDAEGVIVHRGKVSILKNDATDVIAIGQMLWIRNDDGTVDVAQNGSNWVAGNAISASGNGVTHVTVLLDPFPDNL